MKIFLKGLKASDFKGRNQTKTDIQHFQNIITFETFKSYNNTETFEYYYYFDLSKIRVSRGCKTKKLSGLCLN